MSLLLELGNTRIKASLLSKNRYEFIGAYDTDCLYDESLVSLFELGDLKITRVFVASVGSISTEVLLLDKIKRELAIFPHVIDSQPECCGVFNGYDSFKQLGVDRWLAILGACAETNKPTLIIDAGTALTVDVVVDKKHLGGFITPGLTMQHQSLFRSTEKLPFYMSSDIESKESFLATNTSAAVHGGCLYMTGAYINNLIRDVESETGRLFDCVGTGGDFELLAPLLDKPFEYVEDLTLQGMVQIIKNV